MYEAEYQRQLAEVKALRNIELQNTPKDFWIKM
jgi:hypothetical protein